MEVLSVPSTLAGCLDISVSATSGLQFSSGKHVRGWLQLLPSRKNWYYGHWCSYSGMGEGKMSLLGGINTMLKGNNWEQAWELKEAVLQDGFVTRRMPVSDQWSSWEIHPYPSSPFSGLCEEFTQRTNELILKTSKNLFLTNLPFLLQRDKENKMSSG